MPEWLKTLIAWAENHTGEFIIHFDNDEVSMEVDDSSGGVLYSITGREDLLSAFSKTAEWMEEIDD